MAIMAGCQGPQRDTLRLARCIYGLQGLLLWFVSIPLQWIAFSDHLNWLIAPGLILGGYSGPLLLRKMATNPAATIHGRIPRKSWGTTMNSGLWRYTRHPNYFGDALVWAGFYVIAMSAPWGFLTVLSPVTMWWLLTSLSGKPMLERKLSKTRAWLSGIRRDDEFLLPSTTQAAQLLVREAPLAIDERHDTGLQTLSLDETRHSSETASRCTTSVTPTACSPVPMVAHR